MGMPQTTNGRARTRQKHASERPRTTKKTIVGARVREMTYLDRELDKSARGRARDLGLSMSAYLAQLVAVDVKRAPVVA